MQQDAAAGTQSSSASASKSETSAFPTPTNVTTRNATSTATSNGIQPQAFWAGATIDALPRMEAIPGRTFYDFDGTTVKDPISILADAGVNAFRVETANGQCLGPTTFNNSDNPLGRELLFQLDWGCIDIKVKTTQRAVAKGMKFQLTINMGTKIPAAWEPYNYEQMANAVSNETKRQLQPFLDASLLPDIILLENEGTGGYLFEEETTGHARIHSDHELCGQSPNGNMASFPQLAGLYKAQVQACNEAITTAGMSTSAVRYGLHSHGQYVDWKEGCVHGPAARSQTNLTTSNGTICDFASVIPSSLLSSNVSQLLTIMGFSAYPDPMTPLDIYSTASEEATPGRLNKTLNLLQGYAEAYGKLDTGPFVGQYKLQSLGVEYGTSYTYAQVSRQQNHTKLMWDAVKAYDSFLGMQW